MIDFFKAILKYHVSGNSTFIHWNINGTAFLCHSDCGLHLSVAALIMGPKVLKSTKSLRIYLIKLKRHPTQ